MNKYEYLAALAREISALPADEQKETLSFYKSYFEDAGPENEQAVIDELGTPEQLGSYIRSQFACVPAERTIFSRSKRFDHKTESAENLRSANDTVHDNPRRTKIILIVLLLLVTMPAWTPVVFGILGGLLGLFIALIVLGFAGLIAGAAAVVASGVIILGGISTLGVSFPTALLMIGVGLVVCAVGIVLCVFGAWFSTKFFPVFIRTTVNVFSRLFKSRRNNNEKQF